MFGLPPTVVGGSALIACSFLALMWGMSGKRERNDATDRLGVGPVNLRERQLDRSVGDRVLGPAVDSMGRRFRRWTPAGVVGDIESRLMMAGRSARQVERILTTKVVGGIVGVMAAWMLAPGASGFMKVVAILAPPFMGYMQPDIRLKSLASARQEVIQNSLAGALDQITISVEAGLGFDVALLRYAEAGKGPLAEELARTLQDVRLGATRLESFKQLLARTDSPDLRQFVMALNQGERHGLPIAQILRVQAAELRDKRRQRAEQKAATIPVKVVFPMVLCILPVLFIVILGPAAFQIMEAIG
ncbi:MAG: type II secretion system F family protein [Acidimicrobiales bacterium]|jgi:tight adherence protein C